MGAPRYAISKVCRFLSLFGWVTSAGYGFTWGHRLSLCFLPPGRIRSQWWWAAERMEPQFCGRGYGIYN